MSTNVRLKCDLHELKCDEHELANLDEMFHERIVLKNWKVPILIPVPL